MKMKRFFSMILVVFMVLLLIPNVVADPLGSIDSSYVKLFTTQGKPIWVKLSLPSGGTSVSLSPGSSVTFRLDYVFDTLRPEQGDSLQLYASGFPNGTFLLPSNMHTSTNYYRSGIITLNFADVLPAPDNLANGVSGWMTVTFLVSGDQTPGTLNPKITGSGSSGNVLKIEKIDITAPGTDPGPSGPESDVFRMIRKLAEHVLYPNGSGGYSMQTYQYQVPIAPSYISYEILINERGGQEWTVDHIGKFDYLIFTDTLSDGQKFADEGEPSYNPNPNSPTFGNPMEYAGKSPVYGITARTQTLGNNPVNKNNVEIVVSPDRKTFTLKIPYGAEILGSGNQVIGHVDEYTQIRLDYYAKVIEPEKTEITSFKNSANVEYIKGLKTTGGNSSVRIDIIKQAGADFIIKEVGFGKGDTNQALHGYNDPLIVAVGDELFYRITYKLTGDVNDVVHFPLTDTLPGNLEFVANMSGDNYGLQTSGTPSGKNVTITCSATEPGTYWAYFKVKVLSIEPGETVVNTVGTNKTVLKGDGYAIQVLKCDADNKTKYLPGAVFTLYDVGGNKIKDLTTTDNNGKTSVENLAPGKYKLVETTPPTDYPPLNAVVIEFEILPESSGMKGINKILVLSAPSDMPDPSDNSGVAVFKVFNSKETDPKGNISIVKYLPDGKVNTGDTFKVTLTAGSTQLQFNSSNEYVESGGSTDIEINNNAPVFLKNIPLSLGQITIAETSASIEGYDASYTVYTVNGSTTSTDNANVTLTGDKQTVSVTVTNTKSTGEKPPEKLKTSVKIGITKEISGIANTSEIFKFTLKQLNDATAGNFKTGEGATNLEKEVTGKGLAEFTILDLPVGTYYYQINETQGSAKNWTYDIAARIVTVTVKVNAEDSSRLDASYSVSGSLTLTFKNTYTAPYVPPDITPDPTTPDPTTTSPAATTTEAPTTTAASADDDDDDEDEKNEEPATTTTESFAEPQTEEDTTEQSVTTTEPATEPLTEPAISEAVIYEPVVTAATETAVDSEEYEEYYNDGRVPLGNGWFAEYNEDEDLWYIYDENGTPLGTIKLPEGMSIEEYDFGDWVPPLANIPADENKPNPPTGEAGILLYLLLLTGACLMTVIGVNSKSKRKKM